MRQTLLSDFARVFLLTASILVSHLALVFFRVRGGVKVEFVHIQLVVTAAFMILVQSHNFILLFVALETVAIGFYILVAFTRKNVASLEAGIKYLVMGAFSSALLLFGIVLLFGAASNPMLVGATGNPLDFSQLNAFLTAGDELFSNAQNPLVLTGVVLVLAGIAFKMGAFPFQFWIPDVYQGAPSPVTAFLAVSSKASGFFLFYILLTGPFMALQAFLYPILAVVAIATLLFGNTAALAQSNVKRVMGLSGVAHAGILLVGFLAALRGVDWVLPVLFFYMIVYAVASFTVFQVMGHMQSESDEQLEIEDFNNLLERNTFLGSSLVIGLGSLAGIPPLAGFVAKVLIFIAAVQAELYVILAVALLGVVLSIYYYFGWMRAAVFKRPIFDQETEISIHAPSLGTKLFLAVLLAATLVLGLYPALW
ncbi:MAG: NADH-quinone oxidoreductase subunit N [Verrucomicrobia bacterium]|nr:NADH-quinone oxidoreductase subunit N [Verrucomicrobiota bacterium]